MKHLQKGFISLAIGLSLFSCETESIKENAVPENAKTEDVNLAKVDIATFSGLTGSIGQSFKYIDGKSKTIDGLGEVESTNAKFLYVDTDSLDSLKYSYEDLLDWSYDSKVGLIFESATANHENTNDFYLNTVGASSLDYTVEGLVVEQSELSDNTTFIVVNKENGIGAEDTIEIFMNDLYERKYPTVLDSEPSDDNEFYDNDNAIMTEEITETELDSNGRAAKTSSNTLNYYITYQNISQSSAEAKAKTRLKAKRSHFNFKGFEDYRDNLNASLITQKNQKRKYLKTGSKHDALGKCKGQQTATYGRTMSYSKTWSTTFSASVNVAKTFTFGGSYSVGGSKTSGTANTSSISMRKRYAQGGVSVSQKFCTGYVTGNIKFKAKSEYPLTGGKAYLHVTLKYTGKNNKWEGWRQKSQPAFTWETTGYTLRNCK